jgi:hypothetical protein
MRSRSLRIYPRLDKEYRKKESLDFQMNRSNIYLTRPSGLTPRLISWLLFFALGVIMGAVAFCVDIIVEKLIDGKWYLV